MSSISQPSESQPELIYSPRHVDRNQRITNSLQYLDKIRSIKSFNIDNSKMVLPLEKLIKDKQITYIDNQQCYGIIKAIQYFALKKKIQQLEAVQHHSLKAINQHNFSITTYQTAQSQFKKKLFEDSKIIEELKNQINLNNSKIVNIQELLKDKTKIIQNLIDQNNQLQRKLTSKLDIQQSQNQRSGLAHRQMTEVQTQYFKKTLDIPPFEPKLQQILKKLNEKNNEKFNRPTVKDIIEANLKQFVINLDEQYKLIQSQTISFSEVNQQNIRLKQQNERLKQAVQDNNTSQKKLVIFRECMSRFLDDTNQKVLQSIDNQRQRQMSLEFEQGSQNTEIKFLKQQNIKLLSKLGEYQYKWKNIQRILEQPGQQGDEGTVGQLVKMSRLVKESIRQLLNEI